MCVSNPPVMRQLHGRLRQNSYGNRSEVGFILLEGRTIERFSNVQKFELGLKITSKPFPDKAQQFGNWEAIGAQAALLCLLCEQIQKYEQEPDFKRAGVRPQWWTKILANLGNRSSH